MTGDYMAGPFSDTGPASAAAREFLGSIRARHGIVVVAGHSEREADREMIFEGLDLIYLNNEAHRITLPDGRRLVVYGMII